MQDREKDIWEVKCLDAYTPPESNGPPSAAIARMLKQRHIRFEQTKTKLVQELQFVYKEIEANIERFLRELKKFLDDITQKINYFTKTITINDIELRETTFTQISRQLANMFAIRRDGIDFYCKQLVEVESDRLEGIKPIFSKYYVEFGRIGQLPASVQEYFEHEIMYYNEMILNNIRSYADLHLHLILSGCKHLLQLENMVNLLQVRWIEAKNVTKPLLHESVSEVVVVGRPQYKEVQDLLMQMGDPPGLFQDLVSKYIEIPVLKENEQGWSNQFIRVIMHLGDCEQKIIGLFKGALEELLVAHNTDLRKLNLAFCEEEMNNCTNISKLEVIVKQTLYCLQSVQRGSNHEGEKEANQFITALNRTMDLIMNIREFLVDAARVWLHHIGRVRTSEQLVSAALRRHENASCAQALGLETKVNVEMEILRQQASKQALRKAEEKVFKTMDAARNFHVSSLASERSIIGRLMHLTTAYMTTLTEDMSELTSKHDRGAIDINIHDSQTELLEKAESRSRDGTAQSKKIAMCQMQLVAINNWRMGLWEMMLNFSGSCHNEAMEKSRRWVAQMDTRSTHRIGMKTEIHMLRYQRVHREIHNVRLAEVNLHADRLQGHKLPMAERNLLRFASLLARSERLYLKDVIISQNKSNTIELLELQCQSVVSEIGVQNCIAQMKEGFNSLIQNHKQDFNYLEENFKKAEQVALTAPNAGGMAFHKSKIFSDIGKYLSNFNLAVVNHQEECNKKTVALRKSNVYFMKSIRLFFEDGNFSAKEAKELIGAIKAVDKLIIKQQKAIKKLISSQVTLSSKNDIARTDPMKARLTYTYEDLVFGGTVVREIEKLQATIKKEVCNMKSNSKQLNQKIIDIENVMSQQKTESGIPMVAEMWDELITLLMERHSYLLSNNEQEEEVHKDPSATVKDDETMVSDSKDLTVGGLNQDGFMQRVGDAMATKTAEIQHIANNFYLRKGSRPIVRQEMIQDTCSKFMEEIEMKMIYYEEQCREVWHAEAEEFLAITLSEQQTATEYARLLFEGFQTRRVDELTDMQTKFKKCYNAWYSDLLDRRSEMQKRLLPTHGYPGNSQLLADLNEEVLNSFEQHTLQGFKNFARYKENLDAVCGTYHPGLQTIVQHVTDILQRIFSIDLTQLPTNHIAHSEGEITMDTSLEGTDTSNYNVITNEDDGMNSSVDKDVDSKDKNTTSIEAVKNRSAQRSETATENSKTESLLKELRLDNLSDYCCVDSVPSVKKTVTIYMAESSEVQLITPLKVIGEIRSQMSKVYQSHYDMCCHVLNKEVVKHKGESKEWIKNWKSSVKAVKRLYSVSFGCT